MKTEEKSNVHFSAQTDEWATPQYVFDMLNDEFKFTLDAAAAEENAKCKRFFTKEDNGLTQNWGGGNCVLQSAIFTTSSMDTESNSIGKIQGHDSDAHSSTYRHGRFSRLHIQKTTYRDSILTWSSQVWGLEEFRPLSEHGRNF